MKKIFYLLSFCFLISCENSNQLKEIEVLTYYNNARDFIVYSNIDKNGFTEVLFKPEESKNIDNCQIQIRKSLMDSIVKICKNKSDKDFAFKTSKRIWYCGLWHSVRITYENGKTLIFKYAYANSENRQLIPFQSLSEQIQNDSLQAIRLNLGQFGKIAVKQEDFSNIIFKRDSIFLLKYMKKRK